MHEDSELDRDCINDRGSTNSPQELESTSKKSESRCDRMEGCIPYLRKRSMGQVRMEISAVTALVKSIPANFDLVNNIQTQAALIIDNCDDLVNIIGNCFACNNQDT